MSDDPLLTRECRWVPGPLPKDVEQSLQRMRRLPDVRHVAVIGPAIANAVFQATADGYAIGDPSGKAALRSCPYPVVRLSRRRRRSRWNWRWSSRPPSC